MLAHEAEDERTPTNEEIALTFERIAELLETHDADPFRVGSYRRAADELRALNESVVECYRVGGEARLTEIPGIGERLAGAVGELADTGHLRLLDALEAEVDPVAVLARVPGLGRTLAGRAWRELGIDSLEELERAAHDGRLARLGGFGPRRIDAVRSILATMLQRRASYRPTAPQPPVALLLGLDEEYRAAADGGELPTIAPRRFNPQGRSWLPILRTTRDGWRFTVLFSNTARAHRLNKTHDWVVIYFEREDGRGQCTVVTETSGPSKNLRVVRGREAQCRDFYNESSRREARWMKTG